MSEEQSPSIPQPEAAAQQQQKYHLNYESLTAVFADHVVLNSTSGGLIFDFASCTVNDPGSGDATVPIHTRVAMTNNGAAQLFQLLAGIFQPQQPSAGGMAGDDAPPPAPPATPGVADE
jgi:hypothetical protein